MDWQNLSDQEKVDFAKNEYDFYHPNEKPYKAGSEVEIGTRSDLQTIGYVAEVYHDDMSDLDAYVVTDIKLPKHPSQEQLDSVKHMAILYQGSGSIGDWTGADKSIGEQNPLFTIPQAHKASEFMKDQLKIYPNADMYVFAHSLGTANASNALANLSDQDASRLVEANLYEGPYVWNLLTKKQQDRLIELKPKILTYIDLRDLIAISGYNSEFDSNKIVGTPLYIDSENTGKIGSQHMWGGYHFNKKGELLLNGNLVSDASKLLAIRHSKAASAAHAIGGKVASEYKASSAYASYLGKTADLLETIYYHNHKIPTVMAQTHQGVKSKMYGIPLITTADVEECDVGNRLKPQWHYSDTAVVQSNKVLKRGIQGFLDLKNKILNTADNRILKDVKDK